MNITSGFYEKQGYHEIFEETGPDIPLNPENRKKTDRWFSYVFILCIALLVPFLIYTLSYSDINRYNGYDNCGNICGQKNVHYDQWNCTGQDMTLKPILFYVYECVTEATFSSYGNFPSWYRNQNAFSFFKHQALILFLACCIPFGLSLVLALLFRYATALIVWLILIACWIIFPVSGAYLCFLFVFSVICVSKMYMYIEIVSTTLFTTIYPAISMLYAFICMMLFCISVPKTDHIHRITKLLKEASSAALSSRNVIFNTTMTSALSFIIIAIYSIIVFYITTAGILTESYGKLYFIPDDYMTATSYLSVILAFWMVRFVIDVGFLTSSGAIADRYFSKRQDGLVSSLTFKYHSGTVALVSFLSAIMILPRFILILLAQFSPLKEMTDYFLRYLDGFFSKNVYITTALHGTSFSQSGKKAVELARSSIGSTESLHFFGNTLMVLTQTLIVVGSTFIAFCIYDFFESTLYDICITLLISYISTELVLGPLKVAMSTIFFCICQDNLLKEEANKDHAVSLETYLNRSNKLFLEKVGEISST